MAHESFPPDMADLSANLAELTTELDTLSQTDALVASVSSAFHPDTIPLFSIGLEDFDISQCVSAIKHRRVALQGFMRAQKKIHTARPPTAGPGAYDGRIEVRQGRSRFTETSFIDSLRPKVRNDRLAELLEELHLNASRGLRRSGSLDVFLPALQYLYGEESEPVWESDELIPNLSEKDTDSLFGPLDRPTELTFGVFVDWLRANNEPDLLETTLKARFDTFVGIATLELSRFILLDMNEYGQVNGNAFKKMQRLFATHAQAIFGYDLLGKRDCMQDLSKAFVAHSERVENHTQQQIMHLIGLGLETTATHVSGFLRFFANIYAARGFDLPPLLLRNEEVVAQSENTTLVLGASTMTQSVIIKEKEPADSVDPPPPTTDEKTDPSELDEGEETESPEGDQIEPPEPEAQETDSATLEVITKLERRARVLTKTVETFNKTWHLTHTERKRQKLDPVVRALVEGVTNATDQLLLLPIQRDQALEALQVLVGIDRLFPRKYENMQEALQKATKTYQRFIRARNYIPAEYAALRENEADTLLNIALSTPQLPDIQAHVQRLAQNWNGYRELILTAWPSQQAAGVEARIKSFLDLVVPR